MTSLAPMRMAKLQDDADTKCWQGHGPTEMHSVLREFKTGTAIWKVGFSNSHKTEHTLITQPSNRNA